MESETFDLRGISVHIGMPVSPKSGLPPKTAISLCSTIERLTRSQVDYSMALEVSGIVENARDMVLADFLEGDKQKLLWLDSDMVWTADDVSRIVALSSMHDIIAATYPAKVEGAPTYYINHEAGMASVNKYGLMPIYGTGLGFTIVDRKVCEQLAAKAPKVSDQISGRTMACVFRQDIHDGHRMTEDFAFFSDCRALGYTVWLDTTINLGHIGEREWTGNVAAALKLQPAAVAA
jgi:hypothetical protein